MDSTPENWDKSQLALGASFLQSSFWADFQKALGKNCYFSTGDGWSCLLIERHTSMGKYLFAPYGPTLRDTSVLGECLDSLKALGKNLGATWLRIEPIAAGKHAEQLKQALPPAGATPAVHYVDPPTTRVVDLSPSRDELLASISQSTRSLIRKNEREHSLAFSSSTNPADISEFSSMVAAVTDRKDVNFFSADYYKTQAEILMPRGAMHLELAIDQGKPVAGTVIHDYGTTSTYTYGASLPEARSTSASALLLWSAMVNAQQRGIKKLDLFGVAPENATPNHPWYGFSTFKKKFGGEVVERAGTWDIPLNKQYHVYRLANKARFSLRRH